MKLNYKRTRRQTSGENVKVTSKLAVPRPSSRLSNLYTQYNQKPQSVTQFGLGNFVPPSCISPIPGDLLEFDRKLYSHWGVYIGDGQIIHVTGEFSDIATDNVVVKQSSLAKVANSSLVRVNNKTVPAKDRRLKAFEPRKIVSNARKSLGKTVVYDMLSNNAEHYVTMWRYGKAWSDQAETAMSVMTPYKKRSSNRQPPSTPLEGTPELTRTFGRSSDSISSTGSATSVASDDSAYMSSRSSRSSLKSMSSTGCSSSGTSPKSHCVLSDKDASFQMSLLAGLTAIFKSDRPTCKKEESAPTELLE